jgi:hypothetical protein
MKKTLTIFFVAFLVSTSQAYAITVTLGVGAGGVAGDRIIGEVFQINDIAGGLDVRDAAAINLLIALAPGTRTGTDPELFRSTQAFAPLPTALAAGATHNDSISDGGAFVSITLTQGYTYLVGSYDGPNGGSEIWYIAGLVAGDVINIPRYAEPVGSPQNLAVGAKYLMTSYNLMNPTTSVPDGGTTAVLLGMGILGLQFLRRRFNS